MRLSCSRAAKRKEKLRPHEESALSTVGQDSENNDGSQLADINPVAVLTLSEYQLERAFKWFRTEAEDNDHLVRSPMEMEHCAPVLIKLRGMEKDMLIRLASFTMWFEPLPVEGKVCNSPGGAQYWSWRFLQGIEFA